MTYLPSSLALAPEDWRWALPNPISQERTGLIGSRAGMEEACFLRSLWCPYQTISHNC